MHEEEGNTLAGDFIVHVETIDMFRRHTLLVPSCCPAVVASHRDDE
jgi:hypothetical protein